MAILLGMVSGAICGACLVSICAPLWIPGIVTLKLYSGTLELSHRNPVGAPEQEVQAMRAGRTPRAERWETDMVFVFVGHSLGPGWFGANKRDDGTSEWFAGNWQQDTIVRLRLWAVMLVTAPYPLLWFVRGPLRRRRWAATGRCTCCGYDLTGNVTGMCPECGRSLSSRRRSRS